MTFDPLGWFASVKTALIVGAVSLAIGGAGGWYVKGKFVLADEAKQAKAQIVQHQKAEQGTAENIVKSNQASQGIEAKVQASNTAIDKVKSAAAKRIHDQETAREQHARDQFLASEHRDPAAGVDEASDRQVCPRLELDVGTVRLLNAARTGQAGAAMDPAASSDAASQAPSGVGIPALIDNDLDIVKLYHELAERHNALVDDVEKELARRAGSK